MLGSWFPGPQIDVDVDFGLGLGRSPVSSACGMFSDSEYQFWSSRLLRQAGYRGYFFHIITSGQGRPLHTWAAAIIRSPEAVGKNLRRAVVDTVALWTGSPRPI